METLKWTDLLSLFARSPTQENSFQNQTRRLHIDCDEVERRRSFIQLFLIAKMKKEYHLKIVGATI